MMLICVSDYRREFPDYPESDMPKIPAGWIDSSWRNDACPSFTFLEENEGQDSNFAFARVWIAERDPLAREFPESPRFAVTYEGGIGDVVTVLESDNWTDVIAYVAPRVVLSRVYRAVVGDCPFLDDPENATPESVSERLECLFGGLA